MPFNNVTTIQDILEGKKYDSLHGGGSWSTGEDVDKSYVSEGNDYKRMERDLDIFKKLSEPIMEQGEKWKVRMPGGSRTFISFDLAQKFKEELKNKGIKAAWVTRVAQNNRLSVIADVMRKCFMLESIDVIKGVKETGSCFCIHPNVFLTCAHVIKKYNKNIKIDAEGFYTTTLSIVHEGIARPAKLMAVDPLLDIAIIQSDIAIEPLKFAASYLVGENIVAIGSPHGYENNVSSGIIGSLDRSVYAYQGAPKYMFVDLSIFSGSSGGVVVKESSGEVVGMVTLVVAEEGEYGLNAALPLKYMYEFCVKNIDGFASK